MINLIIFAVFLISLLGIVLIILRKVPVMIGLSHQISDDSTIIDRAKEGIRRKGVSKLIEPGEKILHKGLSKFRVLALKTEKKTGNWLSRLRQKRIEKTEKEKFTDDYWEDLKKK